MSQVKRSFNEREAQAGYRARQYDQAQEAIGKLIALIGRDGYEAWCDKVYDVMPEMSWGTLASKIETEIKAIEADMCQCKLPEESCSFCRKAFADVYGDAIPFDFHNDSVAEVTGLS
jgi:hypothetical protein